MPDDGANYDANPYGASGAGGRGVGTGFQPGQQVIDAAIPKARAG